ncbi:MAG: hypothetical protein KC618_09065 [Candidatus Omnitrophica bacterium]|nr:hypothetical protein [Candidatus Omnitrophota bacterium]
MKTIRRYVVLGVLMCLMITQSGCSLLKAPLQLIKVPFVILEKALAIAKKLPKPPPGVFGGF